MALDLLAFIRLGRIEPCSVSRLFIEGPLSGLSVRWRNVTKDSVDLTRVNAGVILHRRAAEKMHHA
jgi:hypothetical protein